MPQDRPPLPVGSYMPAPESPDELLKHPHKLTDYEHKMLVSRQLPVDPAHAAAAMQSAAEQAAAEATTPTRVIRPPESIDIADLDPSAQAEVQEAIARLRGSRPAPTRPTFDPRPSPAPLATPQPAAPAAARPAFNPVATPPEPVVLPAPAAPARSFATETPQLPQLPAKGTDTVVCKWCGGHPNGTLPEITDDQKVRYLAHIHGSRFEEEYELFGGRMTVVFRTLKVSEIPLLYKQADHDYKQKALPVALLDRRLADYSLVASISAVRYVDGEELPFSELIQLQQAHVPAKDGDPTVLPQLLDWFFDRVCSSEGLRVAIGTAAKKFGALVGLLEAQTTNSDFWKAISRGR